MTAQTLSATAAPREGAAAPPTAARPRWVLPALLVLLAGTALLYLWDLGASGYANSFYAAAVQAGTQDWKALLFGSLDPGNGITVDKPPAALWVMGLSGRIFGFSSWSMLVPQALMGVGSVALLYGAVRRVAGYAAGLGAGAALALTPVAVLMFRFNNPDALLVLLMVAAAYAVVRSLERGSVWWLTLAGGALGFGFLTKMLQALLVLPALALVYLVAAPHGLLRRIVHLLVAGAALVVAAGWFVVLVEVWPASGRPYVGGSTDNSLWQLAIGYNGVGRVLGGEGNGGGGGGGGGGGFGGATGITRMFGSEFGTQISWLLPAALIALVAGLWVTRRAPRTNRLRASLLLWGGWLVVTGVVFSYMSGTIHPYYTIALAPAIGGLIGIGGMILWTRRAHLAARATLAGMVVVTGAWSYVLLYRDASWHPWLRYAVLVAALAAAAWLLVGGRPRGRVAVAVAAVLVVAGVAAPAGYALTTAGTPHTGSIPIAGPAGSAMGGMPGGGRAGAGATGRTGQPPTGTGQAPTGANAAPGNGTGTGDRRFGGGTAGPDGGGSADAAVVTLLKASHARWAAATIGSQSAATLELSSGASVLAIGGFTGSDDYPTLAQFQRYVAAGQVRYFISGGERGGGGGPGGGSGTGTQITQWVTAHYTAKTVGGTTVYDLSPR